MTHPPILILAFNRPHHLRSLINQLRKSKPKIIYCAQDGPRKNNNSDKKKCSEVRRIWDEIDWKCEKHFLLRTKNLGCQKSVSGAINWFFSNVEAGIILEDDCIPTTDFFLFCNEMLQTYETDMRVMHISGNNFQRQTKKGYRFSQYPHCWGWATWRRAWKFFDADLQNWPDLEKNNWLSTRFSSPLSRFFWTKIFDGVYKKKIDSWAIPWVYTLWVQNGIAIHPNVNLVTNIGFGKDSTHTPDSASPLSNIPTQRLFFPLPHPSVIVRDRRADDWDQLFVYEQRTIPQIILRVRKMLLSAIE